MCSAKTCSPVTFKHVKGCLMIFNTNSYLGYYLAQNGQCLSKLIWCKCETWRIFFVWPLKVTQWYYCKILSGLLGQPLMITAFSIWFCQMMKMYSIKGFFFVGLLNAFPNITSIMLKNILSSALYSVNLYGPLSRIPCVESYRVRCILHAP